MLDVLLPASFAKRPVAGPSVYQGPERRAASSHTWRWLTATLDEIDYGMLLLDADAQLLHINRVALAELDPEYPLQLLGRKLCARLSCDVGPLHAAVDAAVGRGLRRLLTLGQVGSQISISVVPIGPSMQHRRPAALIMLGKRRVVGELAVQAFARSHGLTSGETRVLLALCNGLRPAAAAAQHGVAISTVRSQIGSIRAKTSTASIRDLVHAVATLPPFVDLLCGGESTVGRGVHLGAVAAQRQGIR